MSAQGGGSGEPAVGVGAGEPEELTVFVQNLLAQMASFSYSLLEAAQSKLLHLGIIPFSLL
jgi:hypothetical protein